MPALVLFEKVSQLPRVAAHCTTSSVMESPDSPGNVMEVSRPAGAKIGTLRASVPSSKRLKPRLDAPDRRSVKYRKRAPDESGAPAISNCSDRPAAVRADAGPVTTHAEAAALVGSPTAGPRMPGVTSIPLTSVPVSDGAEPRMEMPLRELATPGR